MRLVSFCCRAVSSNTFLPRGSLLDSRVLSAGVAVTATLAVPVMECALGSVAVMLWLPGVIKVTALVKVWEPASAAVNVYTTGRIAALSELVKRMGLLKIVSTRPLAVAVTVTVQGEPATTLAGALT